MGEIFERMAPVQALPWTGERLTSETGGQVEIEHLHRYFLARSLCRGLDVLDVASGEGYGAALLAQVARSVVGVEISDDAVRHAQESYAHPHLRYMVGDARSIPLTDACVDAVVSFETIEHFYEHDAFIKEVRRVLRPGGFFIVSSPNRDIYSPAGGAPNPHHVHELTSDEFYNKLSEYFTNISLYGQRPLLGSALIPEDGSAVSASSFLTYERRDERFFEASDGLPRAIYLVAICSDAQQPAVQGSLYIESSAVEGIYSNARAAQAENERLTQRLLDEGAYAQRIQAELNRRDEELAAHVRDANQRENQLSSELKLAYQKLQQTLDELGHRDRELVEHVAWANGELKKFASMQKNMEDLRLKLIETQARLDAVWSSASWKITAPIRFVLRRAPRLHRLIATPPRMILRALRGQPILTPTQADPRPGHEAALPSATREANRLAAAVDLSSLVPAGPPQQVFRLEALPSCLLAPDALASQPGGERLLCVTHVVPYPPRAGNEYRIHQMLRFLAARGRDVLLVLSPLPNESFTQAQAEELSKVYPSLIICHHDGRLQHTANICAELVAGLAGRAIRDGARLLGENDGGEPERARLLGLQRAFCPDPLVELMLHLERAFSPAVVLAEYVFMTRPFALMRRGGLKLVDTIDAYSSKARLVEQHGVSDGLAMTEEEEASLLGRADVVIAIQEREAEIFEALTPAAEVITVGVDIAVPSPMPVPAGPVVAVVASGNPMNVKGLRDFFQFCWPLVRRELPAAEFHVAGAVGTAIGFVPDGVHIRGRVEDLSAFYSAARVVVNPVVAGTGLKIKTIEALAHQRMVVCWPAGADGLSGVALELCCVVSDWNSFAQHVVRLLRDDAAAGEPVSRREELATFFAPETVYAPLMNILDHVE
jgi:SAM-dependent methyltransferase